MYRHVVMFTWDEGVDDAHVAALSAAFDGLRHSIASIRSYVHGPNIGSADGNFDYVVVADFDDEAGFVAYRDHPDHVRVVETWIAGRVTQRSAVQYQTGA